MRMQKDSIRIAVLKTSGRLPRIFYGLSTAAADRGLSIQILDSGFQILGNRSKSAVVPESGIDSVHILFLTSANPVA
jgi:hypothetical protein